MFFQLFLLSLVATATAGQEDDIATQLDQQLRPQCKQIMETAGVTGVCHALGWFYYPNAGCEPWDGQTVAKYKNKAGAEVSLQIAFMALMIMSPQTPTDVTQCMTLQFQGWDGVPRTVYEKWSCTSDGGITAQLFDDNTCCGAGMPEFVFDATEYAAIQSNQCVDLSILKNPAARLLGIESLKLMQGSKVNWPDCSKAAVDRCSTATTAGSSENAEEVTKEASGSGTTTIPVAMVMVVFANAFAFSAF